jgi:hypothetical protein
LQKASAKKRRVTVTNEDLDEDEDSGDEDEQGSNYSTDPDRTPTKGGKKRDVFLS